MNGFLVIARCGMDDIPLGLFETEEAARVYGRMQTTDTVREKAATVFLLDVSEIICVDLVKFVAGSPSGWHDTVANFAEDEIATGV